MTESRMLSADDLTAAVTAAREAIEAGECIVLPTDTVYGIGADAFAPAAVQRLLDAKQRGRDLPPPILVSDAEVVESLAREIPRAARALADAFWPGPLTLVLNAFSSLQMDLGETGGTIAVRVPDHEVARAVLRATGPLAVSSANVHGQEAGTSAEAAREQLGDTVALYVDGGPTPGPVPSTIVDFSTTEDGRVLRLGILTLEDLRSQWSSVAGLPEPEPAADEAPAPEPAGDGAEDPVSAPDAALDAEFTTDGEPEPESMTAHEPESTTTGEPEPMTADEPESTTTGGPDPMTADEPETVADVAPEPDRMADVAPEPELAMGAALEPEPVIEPAPVEAAAPPTE